MIETIGTLYTRARNFTVQAGFSKDLGLKLLLQPAGQMATVVNLDEVVCHEKLMNHAVKVCIRKQQDSFTSKVPSKQRDKLEIT